VRFAGVELELAGDVLTFEEIAGALSRAWDEEILPPELPMSPEQAMAKGMVPPIAQASEWNRDVPPTARREHLEKVGITPLDLETWARRARRA
jgi:hypothetical protein